MEDELDLSTPVERDITSESGAADGMAGGGVDIAAQAAGGMGAELSRMSGADEQQSADKESTTAWDNPDVVSRQNLNSNNDALTSNAQQIWQESYGIKGGDENSQPISEKAKAEKQAADDDKRADFMDRQEREAEDRAERRREWMERTHRIGDMEMSGADLEKLIGFMKNPAMKEKIAERLAKKGMDKDEIKKAQKDSEEWASLKEKESKGEKLSAEEKARAEQLEQQKNVQMYVKEFAEFKNELSAKVSGNDKVSERVISDHKDDNVSSAQARLRMREEVYGSSSDCLIKGESIKSEFEMAANPLTSNGIDAHLKPELVVAVSKPTAAQNSGFTV